MKSSHQPDIQYRVIEKAFAYLNAGTRLVWVVEPIAKTVTVIVLEQASPIAPDLAIEVVSPSDIFRRVIEKAFAYLEAGTQMVWIVEPTSLMITVRVYRSETPIRVLGINDTLTGEDVVEGFSCQVAQLFE